VTDSVGAGVRKRVARHASTSNSQAHGVNSNRNGRRVDLQGMRAIAVLTVFSNHLFEWPSGGFVGVDVFFVLSGFFITGLLIREATSKGKISFRDFYIRRVKRILPSALLVLLVTVSLSYILFPAVRAKETLLDALYAALFASNFRFEAVGADYFQQGQPPSPLQHYWSLSIEEQFYFVWPALLAAIFAVTQGRRRSGSGRAGHWVMLAAMGVVVSASFVWALLLTASDPNAAYFSSMSRVWELGVGALIAISGPWLTRIPDRVRPALSYAGLAGLGASLFLIDSTVRFPAPWAALPVLSTALIVASFHGSDVRSVWILTNPVARWFGDTSYTLYLWHWPVIVLLATVLEQGVVSYLLAVILSLGLTTVTYRFYENPIRKSNWLLDVDEVPRGRSKAWLPRLILNSRAWGVIGGVSAAVIFMAIATITYESRLARVAQESAAVDGQEGPKVAFGNPPPEVEPCYGAPAMVTEGCILRNPEVPLQPPIDYFAVDSPQPYLGACYVTVEKSENLNPCDYGYEGPDAVRIALIGDSHAAALTPALWPILESNKWHLTTYLGTACHLADPAPPGCERAMSAVREELSRKRYDIIFVTNFNQGWLAENFQSAWIPLVAGGAKIVVVPDNPRTSEEALACLTRVSIGEDTTGQCGTARSDAIPKSDTLVAAAEGFAGSSVIDLTKYYCTADWCPSVIGNVIVYRDYIKGNSHVTKTFAETLAPVVADQTRKLIAGG